MGLKREQHPPDGVIAGSSAFKTGQAVGVRRNDHRTDDISETLALGLAHHAPDRLRHVFCRRSVFTTAGPDY